MKNLYYATFEKGLCEVVKSFIKKQDKKSSVKKLYDSSVLFFGDDSFKTSNLLFQEIFVCLDSTKKAGSGAINYEMKHLLERKDLRVNFPANVSSFKLTFLSETKNPQIDSSLKKALEITLRKISKKTISYQSTEAELVILAKSDGENLFLKRIFVKDTLPESAKNRQFSISTAFAMCFLSEPNQSEVVLDPFSESGTIAFVRSICFKRANVIANCKNNEEIAGLKKLAKQAKEKPFSVMNYDFLSPTFPIHFVDKVVTVLPVYDFGDNKTASEFYTNFFEKLFVLKIKIVVLLLPKGLGISKYINEKFDEDYKAECLNFNLIKLKIHK